MRYRQAPLKVCEHCQEPFVPKDPYAPRPARFCSLACYYARGRRPKPPTAPRPPKIRNTEPTITLSSGQRTRAVERQCEECGGKFLAAPAQVARGRGRFCSRSCARKQPRSRAT